MGSFAKMFLNVDSLTEKAQRELEKLLKRPEMKEALENLLITEWRQLLEKKFRRACLFREERSIFTTSWA